jgi:hypothetical protein
VNTTVGTPVKVFALVALVAGLGGAAMLALHKKHGSPAPVVVRSPAPAVTHPSAAATAPKRPAAARPAPPVRKTPPPVVAANGLPIQLAEALKRHRIVVVSVFDPQSSTDAVSFAEARAGAAEAGVGFLGVSVLDSAEAGALTSALPGGELLPSPGVLVYRRPDALVQRIDGFADRDVVAQAAVASVTAPALSGAGS